MDKAAADFTAVSLFHNLSIGELVDQLGHAKAEAAEIKAREDALKAELISRGVESAEGMLFRASVTQATRWTLDAERHQGRDGRTLDRRTQQGVRGYIRSPVSPHRLPASRMITRMLDIAAHIFAGLVLLAIVILAAIP